MLMKMKSYKSMKEKIQDIHRDFAEDISNDQIEQLLNAAMRIEKYTLTPDDPHRLKKNPDVRMGGEESNNRLNSFSPVNGIQPINQIRSSSWGQRSNNQNENELNAEQFPEMENTQKHQSKINSEPSFNEMSDGESYEMYQQSNVKAIRNDNMNEGTSRGISSVKTSITGIRKVIKKRVVDFDYKLNYIFWYYSLFFVIAIQFLTFVALASLYEFEVYSVIEREKLILIIEDVSVPMTLIFEQSENLKLSVSNILSQSYQTSQESFIYRTEKNLEKLKKAIIYLTNRFQEIPKVYGSPLNLTSLQIKNYSILTVIAQLELYYESTLNKLKKGGNGLKLNELDDQSALSFSIYHDLRESLEGYDNQQLDKLYIARVYVMLRILMKFFMGLSVTILAIIIEVSIFNQTRKLADIIHSASKSLFVDNMNYLEAGFESVYSQKSEDPVILKYSKFKSKGILPENKRKKKTQIHPVINNQKKKNEYTFGRILKRGIRVVLSWE